MNMHPRPPRPPGQYNREEGAPNFTKPDRRDKGPPITHLTMTAAASLLFAIIVFAHLAAATYALT